MQGKLALTDEQAHIAKFSEYMCDRLIIECNKALETKESLLERSENPNENLTLNSRQQRLAEENLSVVRHAIHKNIIVNDSLYGFEYDDLYQEGCIWLCKAAISFDETRNIKFATYAERSLPTDFVHTAA